MYRIGVAVVGVMLSFTVLGCAHAQKPDQTVVTQVAEPPAPQKPQLVAATVPRPVDPAVEVDAALHSATVFFDFNSDQMKQDGMDALQRVARVLKKYPAIAIKIEGNCDERGTEEYNLLLGQKRADAARRYLATLGVGPQQLDSVSYGAMRPVNGGHSEDAWAQNRRDELRASR